MPFRKKYILSVVKARRFSVLQCYMFCVGPVLFSFPIALFTVSHRVFLPEEPYLVKYLVAINPGEPIVRVECRGISSHPLLSPLYALRINCDKFKSTHLYIRAVSRFTGVDTPVYLNCIVAWLTYFSDIVRCVRLPRVYCVYCDLDRLTCVPAVSRFTCVKVHTYMGVAGSSDLVSACLIE